MSFVDIAKKHQGVCSKGKWYGYKGGNDRRLRGGRDIFQDIPASVENADGGRGTFSGHVVMDKLLYILSNSR